MAIEDAGLLRRLGFRCTSGWLAIFAAAPPRLACGACASAASSSPHMRKLHPPELFETSCSALLILRCGWSTASEVIPSQLNPQLSSIAVDLNTPRCFPWYTKELVSGTWTRMLIIRIKWREQSPSDSVIRRATLSGFGGCHGVAAQRKEHSPIVLLTDFGYRDHYVGVMKGVIASIAPAANVIDLTHGVRHKRSPLVRSRSRKAGGTSQKWRFS